MRTSSLPATTKAGLAVAAYGKVAGSAGSSTKQAVTAFTAAVTAINNEIDAFTRTQTPAATAYKDIQNQISALKSRGPLNAQEQAALQKLQQRANTLAYSNTA